MAKVASAATAGAGAAPRLGRARVPPVYAIADAGLLGLGRIPQAVAAIAEAGVPWVQIRAKQAADDELAQAVARSLEAAPRGTTLWVNDRADLAALYGAPGLHLGQDDLPPGAARAVVGEACWIGFSTHDLTQVSAADGDPEVDLIALGPIFPTRHKDNPDPVVGLDDLRRARAATAKPLVAIGGVDESNLIDVLAAGADGAALLGAVSSGDVAANCRRLAALASGRALRDRSLYLTGFMGAGKTAVGRRLASRLGVPFVDLDAEIEQRAGCSIPELFRERGEVAFRDLESEALAAVSRRPRSVIATGGGVVERAPNLGTMRGSGLVVWLDVPFDTLAERVEGDRAERPLFRDREQARRLYESRLAVYRRCDLRVGSEAGPTADDVAASIEGQLAGC